MVMERMIPKSRAKNKSGKEKCWYCRKKRHFNRDCRKNKQQLNRILTRRHGGGIVKLGDSLNTKGQ